MGAGLWLLSNTQITQHFCKMPEQHGQTAEDHEPQDPMRAVPSPEHVLKCPLGSAITVTMVSKDPLSKPIICIYRHPLRRDVLWEKKVSHKTFGHRGTGNDKVFFCITKLED